VHAEHYALWDSEGAVSAFTMRLRISENDDAGLIFEKLPDGLGTQTPCAG